MQPRDRIKVVLMFSHEQWEALMEYSNGAIKSGIELALARVVPGFKFEPVNVQERVKQNLAALTDPSRPVTIRFTGEQRAAINTALPEGELDADFAEKVRDLIASGLALYQVSWPETPKRGGKRNGAGRKKKVK